MRLLGRRPKLKGSRRYDLLPRPTLQESIAAEVEAIKRFYDALPVDMSQDEKRRRLDHELNRWSTREARRDLGLSG